jgi:hypothetical protein
VRDHVYRSEPGLDRSNISGEDRVRPLERDDRVRGAEEGIVLQSIRIVGYTEAYDHRGDSNDKKKEHQCLLSPLAPE